MKNFVVNAADRFWIGLVLPVLLFLCMFLFLYLGVGSVSASSDEEGYKVLENAVQRAVVQCYAIEGMYPPNIQYLEDHYGLIVDHDQYIVHYEVFASNILPDITVIDLHAAQLE